MNQNEYKIVKLIEVPKTRARLKGVKDHIDKLIKEALKLNFEGLEHGHKAPKILVIHVLNKEYQMEQSGEVNFTKERKHEHAYHATLLPISAFF